MYFFIQITTKTSLSLTRKWSRESQLNKKIFEFKRKIPEQILELKVVPEQAQWDSTGWGWSLRQFSGHLWTNSGLFLLARKRWKDIRFLTRIDLQDLTSTRPTGQSNFSSMERWIDSTWDLKYKFQIYLEFSCIYQMILNNLLYVTAWLFKQIEKDNQWVNRPLTLRG